MYGGIPNKISKWYSCDVLDILAIVQIGVWVWNGNDVILHIKSNF